MHVPPAMRTWGIRIALAGVIAAVIGYLPGQMLQPDPRSAKLAAQIDDLDAEAKSIAAHDAELAREIDALRTDVGAIESRARADLGMVYPDEIILRVMPSPGGAQ
jgi:outer membrane murein-binding lipoprotein Lpp